MSVRRCANMCEPPPGIHICVSMCLCVHQYIYIYPCVWVCVSAKCHIDRLIAVVSDSVTLWLVDSSLIHTPSWVIGPAHWFPACQPSQEELRGRKRACRYWLAPDQPHHHLPITHTHTHTKPDCSPTACSLTMPSDSFFPTFLWLSSCYTSTFSLSPSVPLGIFVSCCVCHLHQSICFWSEIFLLTDFMSCRRHLTKPRLSPSLSLSTCSAPLPILSSPFISLSVH